MSKPQGIYGDTDAAVLRKIVADVGMLPALRRLAQYELDVRQELGDQMKFLGKQIIFALQRFFPLMGMTLEITPAKASSESGVSC